MCVRVDAVCVCEGGCSVCGGCIVCEGGCVVCGAVVAICGSTWCFGGSASRFQMKDFIYLFFGVFFFSKALVFIYFLLWKLAITVTYTEEAGLLLFEVCV